MNKVNARKLRAYSSKLFSLISRNLVILSFISELDRPRYIYAKLTNQPYFGSLYLASQIWPERKESMRKAIRSELENHQNDASKFYMIEIGSWAGESAVLWADEIRKYSGKLLCIDCWRPFINDPYESLNAIPALMDKVVKKDVIFGLFSQR